MDSLPLGLVLCDESGGVLFRNKQAEALMTSRYGDAIAAQAVTDVLAEGWSNGVAERTIDIYGPPRRTLTIRAAVIDDGRRPLGVLAIIEDISERRRLEDIRRDFIANVSHELKTPMGALGLLAETLQFERDPAVAHRLAERINSEAFRVNRIIEDLLDLSRIEGEGSLHARADPGRPLRRRRHRTHPHRRRAARREGRLRRTRVELRGRGRSPPTDLGHPRAAGERGRLLAARRTVSITIDRSRGEHRTTTARPSARSS